MIVDEQGKEWFVAKDVAEVLGYTNHRKAISDHCKGGNETLLPSAGGLQMTKIINEADVLRLILKSKLPAAEKFEKWVFEDVLPSIRKTGAYMTPQAAAQMIMADPRAMGMALIRLAEVQRKHIHLRQIKKKTAKILESSDHP